MNDINLYKKGLKEALKWYTGDYDDETKKEVKAYLDNFVDPFYRTLEFGTGGLRGIMGAGSNRMNKYTVGSATQGLCNYLKKQFPEQEIKVAIAHNSRNNSKYFANVAADVLSANDIKVYLFDDLRPTPELSFAVRHFKCKSGIVITASHNPKEYNGYKAYWEDGGQIIAPHDENIIKEVNKIKSIKKINFNRKPENIITIGSEVDEIYTDKVKELSLSPEIVKKFADLKIVYTPLHGSGVNLVPMSLKKLGFTNVNVLASQRIPDGNFPTVKSPNPEESAALALALEEAKKTDADLLMGTDPDCDRVGIAVKDDKGQFILLNGNQAATLLIYYLLNKWKENGKLLGKEMVVKTIVTTELIANMAESFNVQCINVLTGFKYIADVIKRNEGSKTFIGGGEESYGYLVGDFVRDKDAVIACSLIAEACAWAKSKEKSLYDLLIEIYCQYGYYKEKLKSLEKKGKAGHEEIKKIMENFRLNPPKEINKSKVVKISDYQGQVTKELPKGKLTKIDLPKSDVLQFFLEDGSKITMRPSGTEPKIKFYFGVKEALENKEKFAEVNQKLNEKIDALVKELKITQ